MSDQNWRTDVDAGDYFLHQKKQLQLSDRRPVIRKASDLVGPGIASEAVRITDYNNLLATFNGYYSSAPGAANAPNSTDAFIGHVISDAALGGRQEFTSMATGTEYSRPFNRSPVDPEAIGWGAWSGQRILPTAQGYVEQPTTVPSGVPMVIGPPGIVTIGDAGIYERTDAGIMVRKQGVYTGSIQVGDYVGNTTGSVLFSRPDGTTTTQLGQLTVVPIGPTVHIPFTVWASDALQGFSVTVSHSEGADRDLWWRFVCTRLGDAV